MVCLFWHWARSCSYPRCGAVLRVLTASGSRSVCTGCRLTCSYASREITSKKSLETMMQSKLQRRNSQVRTPIAEYTCIYTSMWIPYIWTYIYICVYIYIYTYTCVCVGVCREGRIVSHASPQMMLGRIDWSMWPCHPTHELETVSKSRF